MSAAPTTVSPHSARAERALRLSRRAALPSLVRVLAGMTLLAVGLLAWVAGQWMVSERGWEPGAVVQEQGTVLQATAGEELVLWVPRGEAGAVPTCRVSDLVFDQRLKVSAPKSEHVRTVGGKDFQGAGVFTPGSSRVRVACTGASGASGAEGRSVAVAPVPDGPAALRDGRWTVLLAMGLGLCGALLVGRELLGTELTSRVRRSAGETSENGDGAEQVSGSR